MRTPHTANSSAVVTSPAPPTHFFSSIRRPTVSNQQLFRPGCSSEEKVSYFQGLKKREDALLYKASKIKESLFPLRRGSAEGSTRRAWLPVLAEGRGEVFHPKEGFYCEVRARLVIARDAGAEGARADWSSMVSHIFLVFLLAQALRRVGCSVRLPRVRAGRGDFGSMRIPPVVSRLPPLLRDAPFGSLAGSWP